MKSSQLLNVAYKTFLLLGAPGSGKGTQGRIMGEIPGFHHLACGDVFRAANRDSEFGRAFLKYSSHGQLVPDDTTIGLWSQHLQAVEQAGKFRPQTDFLVLDGIPRNVHQAKMMAPRLDIWRIFHLECEDRGKIYERLRRRAQQENRADDATDEVIARRLKVYEDETKPVLDFYGSSLITSLNAAMRPYQVLREILNTIDLLCKK